MYIINYGYIDKRLRSICRPIIDYGYGIVNYEAYHVE